MEQENIKILDGKGELWEDPNIVSQLFNDYYCNVANDLLKGETGAGTFTKTQQNVSMYLTPTTETERPISPTPISPKECKCRVSMWSVKLW